MSIYKRMITGLLCFVVALGMGTGIVHAEDELTHGLPEVLTGMDENGNIYEVDTAPGIVEEPMSGTAFFTVPKEEAMVVNFNTKGFSGTTTYKEVETGISGYTCGAYGADAAYLGTSQDGSKVTFMLAGVIGQVSASEVQVVKLSSAKSLSHYIVSDGRLYHKIATNLTSGNHSSTLEQGKAPAYLQSGTKYYSYDGHYFYSDYGQMLEDYENNVRTHSVNANAPYYNYFQFLPFRSQTNYSGDQLNGMINNRVSATSKMRDLGNTFVSCQNTYGVNALLMTGVAANESAWGTSNISQTKNNLFGLNAVDSSPGESANYYPDVKTCAKDFAETYLSKQYLNPKNWKYYGGYLGNKASGVNLKYASDPYWGEKAANVAWILDKANGKSDDNAYTIGIKDLESYSHTPLNVRKEATTASSVVYKSGVQSSYAFLIKGESGDFYKIQSDGVLNADRSGINGTSGFYDFERMNLYASKKFITKVSSGTKVSENVSTWSINGLNTSPSAPQVAGEKIKLTANVGNPVEGLTYKFVWQKNDWADWGVIQDFSEKDSATWTPKEEGEYKLYLDVQDRLGRKESISIPYSVKGWSLADISVSPSSPQAVGTAITITPKVEGNKTGLTYKYVWEKNDWDDWGVIQEFSSKTSSVWTPKEKGEYHLYVDVQDKSGFKVSKSITFIVEDWKLGNITVDKGQKMSLGETAKIVAKVSAPTKNLKYKFVWMKDDWAEWGVIQDFSSSNQANWTPKKTGEYKIYVDVKDGRRQETMITEFTVEYGTWEISDIKLNPKHIQTPNAKVKISPQISGSTYGLTYKFVWQKDDWADWGVIQEFSKESSAVWVPKKVGNYKLYVDVKDLSGKTVTKIVDYEIGEWEYTGVEATPVSPQYAGTSITLKPNIKGNKEAWGLEYKFVWQKDDWAEWEVIQNFSKKSSAVWIPKEAGTYKIYIDVKDESGEIVTKTKEFKIKEWEVTGIKFIPKSPQIVGTSITMEPVINGNKEALGLEYKFVWQKNDWADWGVIQERSSKTTAVWKPNENGDYKLYVDVFAPNGTKKTIIQDYKIRDWEISLSPSANGCVDIATTIGVKGISNRPEFEYKFVWEKDDWAEWGVVQDFSKKQSATWTPEKTGKYRLYVDIKDTTTGDIVSKKVPYTVSEWKISLNPSSQGKVGKTTTISLRELEHVPYLEYKFVWMKDDWAEWGVIQNFSSNQKAKWTPSKKGTYYLYVDVKNTKTEEIVTKSMAYKVK